MSAKKRARPQDARELSYEEIRLRLEEIVSGLERGEGTLEESLAAYEEGVSLVRAAHGMLDSAEKRLEILKPGADGAFRTEDASHLAAGAEEDAESEEES